MVDKMNTTEQDMKMEMLAKELRFAYQQNQSIYNQLSAKVDALAAEVAALKKDYSDLKEAYDAIVSKSAPICDSAAEEAAPVEEVAEEVAATEAEIPAESDELVVRYKKSFTAKMKQSDEKIKSYYSDIKNAFDSYKRINSTVSIQGDRFNFGRDTIAKLTIVGKTLKLYLALNPNDPELKETVYHQKDVSDQRAYESTPFLMKVKSDVAVKKAIRLVSYLAEKLQTEKEKDFKPVDYVARFAYETDEQLIKKGLIKVTQEKKVNLNF